MKRLLNMMRLQAALTQNGRSGTRLATVESYDPDAYAVKVKIQPDGVLTGWLPLASIWVGNGWGIFAPPSIGDQVEIEFQENHPETGISNMRLYSDVARPLSVPSGEFWVVHKSGSGLKFHNDGSVEIIADQDLKATVGGKLIATVDGDTELTVAGDIKSQAQNWAHTGPVQIDGPLTVTQAITGQGGIAISGGPGATATIQGDVAVSDGDVTADGLSLKNHRTSLVQPGTGIGGPPVP